MIIEGNIDAVAVDYIQLGQMPLQGDGVADIHDAVIVSICQRNLEFA